MRNLNCQSDVLHNFTHLICYAHENIFPTFSNICDYLLFLCNVEIPIDVPCSSMVRGMGLFVGRERHKTAVKTFFFTICTNLLTPVI